MGCSYDGSIVYIELESGKNYHSTDYGVTWTANSDPTPCSSSSCFISVSGDGKYVYKVGFNTYYRSSDSGKSFEKLGGFSLPFTFPTALAVDRTGQNIFIAEYFSQSRLLFSSQYGATDSFIVTSAPQLDYRAIGTSEDFQNVILVSSGLGSNNHVRIHYSRDGGNSFTLSNTDFYGGWHGEFSIACDRDCKYAAVSGPWNGDGQGIWYTSNYGASWQLSKSDVLSDTRVLAADRSGQYMLAGLGQSAPDQIGLWFSNNFGQTWSQTLDQIGVFQSLAAPKNFTTAYALLGSKGSGTAIYNVFQGTAVIPPTATPTAAPSRTPTRAPSLIPTAIPTTTRPTASPTTAIPSASPTIRPTAIPTTSPTAVPTTAPTARTRTKVTLVGNATISGISSSSFDEDYSSGFELAIAASVLDGKTAESQVISVADAANGRRRRRLFSFVGMDKKVVRATTSEVIIVFNVSAIMEETGLTAVTAFDVMYGNLQEAFSSGDIQTATNTVVSERKGGSYTPIAVLSLSSARDRVSYDIIQQPSSQSSDDGMSSTNIIIIVVVVVVVVGTALVGLLVYYLFFRSSRDKVGYASAPQIPSKEAGDQVVVANRGVMML